MSMETRRAADIHEQLKTLCFQLEELETQRRILVMSAVQLNKVKYSKMATAAALAGLDAAIGATCWMETLPTEDGDYPVLRA